MTFPDKFIEDDFDFRQFLFFYHKGKNIFRYLGRTLSSLWKVNDFLGGFLSSLAFHKQDNLPQQIIYFVEKPLLSFLRDGGEQTHFYHRLQGLNRNLANRSSMKWKSLQTWLDAMKCGENDRKSIKLGKKNQNIVSIQDFFGLQAKRGQKKVDKLNKFSWSMKIFWGWGRWLGFESQCWHSRIFVQMP